MKALVILTSLNSLLMHLKSTQKFQNLDKIYYFTVFLV